MGLGQSRRRCAEQGWVRMQKNPCQGLGRVHNGDVCKGPTGFQTERTAPDGWGPMGSCQVVQGWADGACIASPEDQQRCRVVRVLGLEREGGGRPRCVRRRRGLRRDVHPVAEQQVARLPEARKEQTRDRVPSTSLTHNAHDTGIHGT